MANGRANIAKIFNVFVLEQGPLVPSTGENWKNNIIYTQGTGIWQEVLLWCMPSNLHLMFHGMRRLHCQEFMDRIAEDTWTCATRLTKVVQNRMIQPYDCKISGLSIRISSPKSLGFWLLVYHICPVFTLSSILWETCAWLAQIKLQFAVALTHSCNIGSLKTGLLLEQLLASFLRLRSILIIGEA